MLTRLIVKTFLFIALAVPATAQESEREVYTTINGDTLYAIADREDIYADATMWVALWEANKSKLPAPGVVPAGIELTIPRDLSILEIMDYRRRAAKYSPQQGAP